MPRLLSDITTHLRQVFREYRPGEHGPCIGCGRTVVFGTGSVIDLAGDLCCDEECHLAFQAERGM